MIFWLGGSPCAGKSTIARTLADRYGLAVFHCDDTFDRHLRLATTTDQPTLARLRTKTADEVWLEPVRAQVEQEIAIYREQWPLLLDEIAAPTRPLIVEGAALLPDLVAPLLADRHHAIWVVPDADFQREHYSRRPWTADVLAACSDPAQGYAHWMQRDITFARWVRARVQAHGLASLVVDGRHTLNENAAAVAKHFVLSG